MKRTIAMFLSLSSAGLLALTGCGTKEGNPGGPGANNPDKPLVGSQDNTFTITSSSVTVYAGGKPADSSIGIKRGTGFTQEVGLEFGNLPSGVKLTPATKSIPNGTDEVKFTVTADDNATPGEYVVKVTGKPASGPNSNVDLKLTVKPRATFSLDPPGNALWSAGVKQGETKNYTVAISRDDQFVDDVTIKFDNLPKGVTIEPSSPVIKSGISEAKVVVKAAADAPIGDFRLKVTGHPTKGADVTTDMKFAVSEK